MQRVVLLCLVAAFVAVSAQPEVPLTWVTLGDWGSVNADQQGVAVQLGLAAAKYNASFLITTGDNFYFLGILAGNNDPQWNKTWREVYTHPSLGFTWYVSLGNHDHYGFGGAPEIAYSKAGIDKRWHLPDYYYTETFTVGSSRSKVQFLFIDTVILAPHAFYLSSREELSAMNASPQLYAEVDAQISQFSGDPRTDHLTWLNQTLDKSTAEWRFAVGHYPVYSGGEHGDTAEMINDVLPIFARGKVDAFLCGHDHNLQHNQGNGMDFYVIGSGTWRGTYKTTPQAKWGVVDPGFTVHQLYADRMVIRFINSRGQEIYTYTQQRKPK